MNRSEFNALLTPGLAGVFYRKLKDTKTQYEKVITIKKSKRAWEEEYKLVGVGRFRQKGESAVTQYDEPLPGDTIRYTHLTYALGVRVSEEMFEDDLYGIANRMTEELARSARINREVQGHAPFNNAFNSAFTGFDGVELCSNSHVQLDGGAVTDNLVTGDLDYPSLQSALELFMSWEDDRSIPIDVTPTMLMFSYLSMWSAHEILESEYRPTDADMVTNVVRTKFGLVPHQSRWLSDLDSWFVKGAKDDVDIKMWNRSADRFRSAEDPYTGDYMYFGRHRLSTGFGDWRGIVGSAGA